MKRLLTAFIFVAMTGFIATPPAQAAFGTQVTYPDGALAFVQFVGFDPVTGGSMLAFIHWSTDTAGDGDISTVHVDDLAAPIPLTLTQAPGGVGGLAYWLNLITFDLATNTYFFDVYVNQGAGGFIFIGSFAL